MITTAHRLPLAVLCVLVVAVVFGNQRASAANFDLFLLSQQWPATSCTYHKCMPSQLQGITSGFSIHGLWPNSANGSYPANCHEGSDFNPDLMKNLLPELNQFWPSLFDSSMPFWEHEYSKHAQCCMDYFPEGQYQFFSNVLTMRSKIDLIAGLRRNQIVPSNDIRYEITEITSVISREFGGIPIIQCDGKKGDKALVEVWMCMTKGFKIYDCPASLIEYNNPRNGCEGDTLVRIPILSTP